jgi:Leucine-rich repeat (LRR) protein
MCVFIQSLHPIFAKNNKLEYISLSTNHIQTLHPLIFDDLPELEEVGFSRNLTINKNFYQFNMKLLRVVLKPLFNNSLLKFEDRVRELELVS